MIKKVLILFVVMLPLISSAQVDSCAYYKSKYLGMKDTAMLNSYRVRQVKYYLKIVDKHPKNAKYLRGWMNRAVR